VCKGQSCFEWLDYLKAKKQRTLPPHEPSSSMIASRYFTYYEVHASGVCTTYAPYSVVDSKRVRGSGA